MDNAQRAGSKYRPTGGIGDVQENPLAISFQDSNFIPHLNRHNVLDYFARSPFYSRQCNNENIRMQGKPVTPENLSKLTGIEYVLLHWQEPILYVIRKQHRMSPAQTTTLANYYIIAGIIYQAPDLFSVVNSRLLNSIIHLQNALDETLTASKYTPGKGYHWDFGKGVVNDDSVDTPSATSDPEAGSSLFQREYVDLHLAELAKRLYQKPPSQSKPPTNCTSSSLNQTSASSSGPLTSIKAERPHSDDTSSIGKPPPEKKMRI